MSLILDPTGSYRHSDDPGEPSTTNPRLSVTDLEAAVLAALVRGRRVLEIGTGLGVSTRALASTAESVLTVDIDSWVWETVWPDLPDNVTGAIRPPEGQTFDAAFIDGDHSTRSVRRDIATARSHLDPGGVLIAHDTSYASVEDALGDGWHFIPTTHGLGVSWV